MNRPTFPRIWSRKSRKLGLELIEAICETDDELMMQYLEGEEIGAGGMMAALRRACIAVKDCPGSVRFVL